MEFFWSIFCRIRTECGNIQSIFTPFYSASRKSLNLFFLQISLGESNRAKNYNEVYLFKNTDEHRILLSISSI